VQIFPNSVGNRPKLFCRSVCATHPERRIAEPLCTHRVPACKRSEGDVFFAQFKGLCCHSVGFRIGLERPYAISTQVISEETLEAGVLHRLIEHRRRKVGEERESQTAGL